MSEFTHSISISIILRRSLSSKILYNIGSIFWILLCVSGYLVCDSSILYAVFAGFEQSIAGFVFVVVIIICFVSRTSSIWQCIYRISAALSLPCWRVFSSFDKFVDSVDWYWLCILRQTLWSVRWFCENFSFLSFLCYNFIQNVGNHLYL